MLWKRRTAVCVVTFVFVFLEFRLRTIISQNFVYGLWTSVMGESLGILRINNYGIAFGFLGDSNPWVITLIALSLLFVIYLFWVKHRRESVLKCCGMILFLSGALCNMFDRIVLGYVRDYIAIRINGYYLPILNLSDITIAVGTIILLIILLRSKEEDYVKATHRQ